MKKSLLLLICLGVVLSACSIGKKQKKIRKKRWITDSGIEITILKQGEGQQVKNGDRLTMNYTGWLMDGTQFDSSIGKKPFVFTIGQGRVIKGWEQGILGMKVGEKRLLVIPDKLGYGARGAGRIIPPNAKLKFEVELLKIN